MKCWICERDAVYKNPQNDKALCDFHFKKYFERKVFKTIREYKMIEPNDKIGIAISGEKDSVVLLYMIWKFTKKYGQKIFAFTVDEGIEDYRKKGIRFAKKITEKLNVEYHIFSYKEEIGYTLPELVSKVGEPPCRICGVIRRYLMNKKARELGATKLATGHNLNDGAENILLNVLRGKIIENAKLGPVVGAKLHPRFVRKIKPLYFMTAEEIKLYADLNDLEYYPGHCKYRDSSFRFKVRKFLDEVRKEDPGVLNKVVNGNLEVLPILKEHYKGKIKSCKICGEPSSGDICRVCKMLKKI